MPKNADSRHADIIIIGAGIAGIGMARYLTKYCPDKTFLILERRQNLGGTWDFFRYPGIRCDSDMYTLGYAFKPWKNAQMITEAPAILEYLQETVQENGIEGNIRYGLQVKTADWSTDDATWRLKVKPEAGGRHRTYTCNFLLSCTGYYNYDQGYQPEFEGQDDFAGPIVHPQRWPDDLDYAGKRVVVIGSGATAVTLIPSMADSAKHVTMLQRSPSYVMSIPRRDPVTDALRRVLPEQLVHRATRLRNASLQFGSYQFSRRYPNLMRKLLLGLVERQIGDVVDMRHFKPFYNPWDERLCAVPDGDFFKVLRAGKASIITDHIDRITRTGIRLKSGQELDADIIVSATGLNIQVMGGIALTVDGVPRQIPDTWSYKSLMFSDIPNLIMVVGYVNVSWTMKVDFTGEYAARLFRYMDSRGYDTCVPVNDDPTLAEDPDYYAGLTSGYVQRALHLQPKIGNRSPWRPGNNFLRDLIALRYGAINDGVLRFSRQQQRSRAA